MTKKYFARLQVLRALAIVMVLAAHAQLPGFKAGFVGVDIFFVLSGFLVVGRAQADLISHRFSATDFMLARALRLLPAGSVVIALTMLGMSWLMLASEYKILGLHLAASVAGFENVLLWREGADYFASVITERPFMHFWSLAVEAQFYVLLIGLVWCCKRFGWRLHSSVWGIFFLSGAIWIWSSWKYPIFAYYLFPARGWEFMAGALVALYGLSNRKIPISWHLLPWLVFIALQLMPNVPRSLLQFLGVAWAVVFLVSSQGAWGQFFAKASVVQWFGNHAYSLYLLHWPLWFFSLHLPLWFGMPHRPWLWALLLVVAATLLHAIVEKPGVRLASRLRATAKPVQYRALAYLIVIWGVLGGLGALLWQQSGWPQRFSEPVRYWQAFAEDLGNFSKNCIINDWSQRDRPFGDCTTAVSAENLLPPAVALWGDSHAAALFSGWSATAPVGLLLSSSCCPAWLATPWRTGEVCNQLGAYWLENLLVEKGTRQVILVARWSAYWYAKGFGFLESQSEARFISPAGDHLEVNQLRLGLVAGLHDVLMRLSKSGKLVTVIGPVPELYWSAPECLVRKNWLNKGLLCDMPRDQVMARLMPVERALKKLVADFDPRKVRYLSAWPIFCDAEVCRASGPEGAYYYDDDHLSATGARRLISALNLDSNSWPSTK